MVLPRLIVIDDLFGRTVAEGGNREREDLCRRFGWRDCTGDQADGLGVPVQCPWAEAVFFRGQSPAHAKLGDTVENDLESCLRVVRRGWRASGTDLTGHAAGWCLAIVDLCFYTGRVTKESHSVAAGVPEGRPSDERPERYFGLRIIEALRREYPQLPVVILSSMARAEVSLEFSRLGVLAFVPRTGPDGPILLREAVWHHALLPDPAGEVVGHSLPILLALREARRAAGHRHNVLARGERGTGKELFASYIHRCSGRERWQSEDVAEGTRSPALVTVNSAVFTPNLFASELFGIQPRTATGVDGKVGLVEMASGGDMFLDEIADMPPEVQAAMLRVLQERQITRVGGRELIPVDVRFISATNVDLETPERRFRADLLDRLRIGGTIWLPALRERPDDIPLLAERFILEAESLRPGIRRREITPDALRALEAHEWSGNVRELRGVLFDAVNRHPDVEHLVASHLRIEAGAARGLRTPPAWENHQTHRKTGASGGEEPGQPADLISVDQLMRIMREFRFHAGKAGEWAGRLPEAQAVCDWLLARHLEACLQATRRRTPEHPKGVVQVHPAIKLLTGDTKITASKAADIIKRLLGPLEGELEGDLADAYAIAVRLRPKSAAPVSRSILQ